MDFETKLQEFGLSQKEARVYVTLLELGKSPASDVAEKSEVKRATTYVVLDSLKEMGLISTYEKNGTTQYVASDPSKLGSIIESKKQEWIQKSEELSSLLPELESLHNAEASKPTIRFFEGKDSLLESYEEFLKSDKKKDKSVRFFYSRDKIDKALSKKDLESFVEYRLQENIDSEVIYNKKGGDLDAERKGDRIKVEETKFPIDIDLEIYGDSIFISTLEKPLSAILIKNQKISDSFKTLFRLAQIGAQAENEHENKSETE